jgi:uracil-DNA glycosylase
MHILQRLFIALPPDNKPTLDEIDTCMNYLRQELQTMKQVKVILALGSIAWDAFF